MKTENVKGFKDYSGEEAQKRAEIKRTIVDNFEQYGFEPAETPIIEYEEFVKGDNAQDETISDIYKLKDKGKRKLALRYEFTFQLKRLIRNKKLPYKRYQIGPVFRDEPSSVNRLRQFTQCDIDTIGSTIKEEAEILATTNETLKKIGITPIILINNRKLMNEILEEQKVPKKYREQVLREIDKYNKLSEKQIKKTLKKFKADKVLEALKQGEDYFNKFPSYKEIIELLEYCKVYGFQPLFSPTVVRGLSYYNGTVFEIKTKGVKDAVAGGGSYKFNNIQCTGISFGLERISSLTKIKLEKEQWLVISLNQDRTAIRLAEKLRKRGKRVSLYYGKPSKALEYANSYKISKVVFVGEREVKKRKFKVKDMKSGKESKLNFS